MLLERLIIVAVLLTALCAYIFWPSADRPADKQEPVAQQLPKASSFTSTPVEKEEAVPEKKRDWTHQIPDLSRFLSLVERHPRPDARAEDRDKFLIGLMGWNAKRDKRYVAPGELQYILIPESLGDNGYRWSPANAKTPLAIELSEGKAPGSVQVTVHLRNRLGEAVTHPEEHRVFMLEQRQANLFAERWELDGQRVGPHTLLRQGVRWYGADAFLRDHGGDELAAEAAKQRLSFGSGEQQYTRRLGVGDYLVWAGGQWVYPSAVSDSRDYPLLSIRSANASLLRAELWGVGAHMPQAQLLNRGDPSWRTDRLLHDIRLTGLRTRESFTLRIGDEDLLLSVGDWLFLAENAYWDVIDSSADLDGLIDETQPGQLLVFDSLDPSREQLSAHLYDIHRASSKQVEFQLEGSLVNIEGLPPQRLSKQTRTQIDLEQGSHKASIVEEEIDVQKLQQVQDDFFHSRGLTPRSEEVPIDYSNSFTPGIPGVHDRHRANNLPMMQGDGQFGKPD